MTNAAPSAMTKPSRSASNGRDACAGSSLRVLSAPIRANAEIVSGVTPASVPPATMTSALPSRSMRAPSPIALAPDAHAVEMQRFGPVQPKLMAMVPAVALGIIIVTKNGLTRLGPRSMNVDSLCSIVSSPPTPVAAITAQRLGSAPISPASASASAAAPKPRCVKRSWRRTSFGPKYSLRLEVEHLAGDLYRQLGGSHRWMRPGGALPRADRRPERGDVATGGRLHAHAGDGDPRSAAPVEKGRSVMPWLRPWPSRGRRPGRRCRRSRGLPREPRCRSAPRAP